MSKIKQTKVIGVPLKADEKTVDDYNAAVDNLRNALGDLKRTTIQACLGITAFAAMPWAEEVRRNAELMNEARIITGKSEADIRAAVAQSSLSFNDFVQQLKAGYKI